jgi:hypothetical protein
MPILLWIAMMACMMEIATGSRAAEPEERRIVARED